MIRSYVNFDFSHWDLYLIHFELACNTSNHTSTSFVPFYLKYGKQSQIIPFDTLDFTNPSAADFITHIHNCQKYKRQNSKTQEEYIRKSN